MSDQTNRDMPGVLEGLEELARRPPIPIRLDGTTAFVLLAQLQLALRHPGNDGPSRAIAESFARALQAAIQTRITPSGPLAEIAERGWHAEFDVPREAEESGAGSREPGEAPPRFVEAFPGYHQLGRCAACGDPRPIALRIAEPAKGPEADLAICDLCFGDWLELTVEEAPHYARCRVCGCTDDDCSACVARTGRPCYWVEPDLCSACADRRGT